MELSLTAQKEDGDFEAMKQYLREQNVDFAPIFSQITLYHSNNQDKSILLVAADEGIYDQYIHLTDGSGRQRLNPGRDGLLVCNKLTETTGIGVGTELALYDTGNGYRLCSATVGGTCRNYLGRKAFLSSADYRRVFGSEPECNTLLVRLNGQNRDAFVEQLRSHLPHVSVALTDEIPEAYSGCVALFRILLAAMTSLSILLSFFVLTNLVNIFVQRRRRELIIMSVNGFTFQEQVWYLLKESLLTTLIGLLSGVGIGCAATELFVRIVERDDSMFVRSPHLPSWLLAVALEALFSVGIHLFEFRRVKKLKVTELTR